jgi:hypothetical protein
MKEKYILDWASNCIFDCCFKKVKELLQECIIEIIKVQIHNLTDYKFILITKKMMNFERTFMNDIISNWWKPFRKYENNNRQDIEIQLIYRNEWNDI